MMRGRKTRGRMYAGALLLGIFQSVPEASAQPRVTERVSVGYRRRSARRTQRRPGSEREWQVHRLSVRGHEPRRMHWNARHPFVGQRPRPRLSARSPGRND